MRPWVHRFRGDEREGAHDPTVAPTHDRVAPRPLSPLPPSSKRPGITRKRCKLRGANDMAGTPTGQRPTIAAEAFLRALADHGVDHFFCNPGTDFAPIVEAFSRAKKTNAKVPKPILVPHENLALGMAHGAYLMTGHPQAVMVHTTVGTGTRSTT